MGLQSQSSQEAPLRLQTAHSSHLEERPASDNPNSTHHREKEDDGTTILVAKDQNDESGASSPSSLEQEKTIISWAPNDPENPFNWSSTKKSCILFIIMMTIINSTLGSSLPSNAIPNIMQEFRVDSEPQKYLPISVYLIGYVMGPIFWAPLSEQYGRRVPTVLTFSLFTVFTMACGLAQNWGAFIGFRLLSGVFASGPIATAAGIFADIYDDPRARGQGMALFMVTTGFGPLLAPIISGFTAPTIGWRWAFWIGLIYAGATMLPLLIFLPETYAPVLLQRRAARMRRDDPSAARVFATHELNKPGFVQLATVVLTRPVRMFLFEPIVGSSCAFLSICYAIFYMSFQAYPLVFEGVYGLSPGDCGLTYLGIGAGLVIGIPILWTYDAFLARAKARGAPWSHREEFRRLPLACLGGPLFVISLFWLGWSSRKDVHFVVPMLAGIPFGLGFTCIFIALLNYLVDAYGIFAASANAAASCTRAMVATVLPFATAPMFGRLGIAGACSLLGGLSLLMSVVPFVFIWKGEQIRARSRFCVELKKRREEAEAQERERELQRERAEEALSSSGGDGEKSPMSGDKSPTGRVPLKAEEV